MHLMKTTRNPRRNLLLLSRIQILRNCVTRCGEPYSKEHKPVCRAQNAICNGCNKKSHFQIVCKSIGKFPHKQNLILPIESKHITFQKHQLQLESLPTLDSTMNKAIRYQNLPDILQLIQQFILFQLSLRTFRTFNQKLIQNFHP